MHPNFFISETEGALFDTRRANWYSLPPLRAVYRRTFHEINDTLQLRATLRAGPYAWPGVYPLYFVTDDGEALSFDSVRANYRQCASSIRNKISDGWRIVACEVNWEDAELTCSHSGEPIECVHPGNEE